MLDCNGCHRYVRVDEEACPFCGTPVHVASAPAPTWLAVMALAVGLAMPGCESEDDGDTTDSTTMTTMDGETGETGTTGDGDGDGDTSTDTTGDGDGDTATGDGDPGDGDGDYGAPPPPCYPECWF